MNQKVIQKERFLLGLFVAWGAMIFWIAPHLPMVDIPQHAAQISLLRDLLTGKSPWSAQLQINLVTPYLIGYGLASLLSFVMPVVTAMKLLLSVAYISFFAVSVACRKRVSTESSLDWMFVPTFFGFCLRRKRGPSMCRSANWLGVFTAARVVPGMVELPG